MGPVENEDYGAVLARFAANSRGPGAVGTLECSRVVVGPQCGLSIEVYGTEGSATWNFERMNELKLAVGRGGANAGYTTILGNPGMGDYGKFQPGPGNSMGYDDLKVIEARSSCSRSPRASPAPAPSTTRSPRPRSSPRRSSRPRPGSWVKVPAVHGRHLRRRAGRCRSGAVTSGTRPLVVGLGKVEPDLVTGVLGDGIDFVAEPDRRRPGRRAGGDRPRRRGGRRGVPRPHTADARARPHRGRHRPGRPRRRPPPAASPWW